MMQSVLNRRFVRGIRLVSVLGLISMFLMLAVPRTAKSSSYGFHHGYRGHFGHHHRSHRSFGHGFHGSFGHYYGPSYFDTRRLALTQARLAGLGALDLNVRPRKTNVYLDGNYIGLARQFDGTPDYLWLKEGTHQLEFRNDGYQTVEQKFTVHPGVILGAKFRLQKGDDAPQKDSIEPLDSYPS